MNTQPIRKLPGTKKEFPLVKSKIDNKRPVKLAKPTVNATKPMTMNPDKIHLVPANSTMAEGAPQMPKVGFRFQGFGSTSITAAIPKSQTIRPLPTHLDKKIHPRDWTFSPKPELTIAIKKTDGTDLKPKPFKANPVPSSHYNKPYQTPKKSKTVMAKKPDAKNTDGTDLKPFKANPVPGSDELYPPFKIPKITKTEVAKKANAPGLVNRMWHSVVDPILHPHNEASPETVTLPDKKKNVDNFTSKKQFRAKPAPPTTQKPSIPVVPQKRLPVRNVKSTKHLDADEKAELQEFELTEKAIHQQVDAHKEMTPSHSLNKIGHGEENVHNADLPDHPGLASRMWHSVVDPILHKKEEPDEKSIAGNEAEEKPDEQTDVQDEASTEQVITSEPEKKESATGHHSHPKLVETAQPMAENAVLPDHPGLASRMWHSVVDPILLKKEEPDEKSIGGNDAEGTLDEKKLNVQDEVLVDEDPQTPEADTSEKSDLDVELPSVPEAHHVKKITKEIVTEAAVPDENEIAPNPEADLDPTREAVEISPFTRTVESRLETEAAGTRKHGYRLLAKLVPSAFVWTLERKRRGLTLSKAFETILQP
ncbi:hypothetical protein DAPPUDRAFT_319215 [Daphnia pulex]|uniref:Uncharacterized protein n=1 Tax=Daphnia pulex TaxID=6669 RepID=E9GL14_DAPPU|nr:hypothetical protein DAPPUDRAFT_319215 [Daphnia pulex]|eukprot:EFX79871.1 hypothetical protein DAPPUDRAFT_319215 [Daphnia pulex]